MKDVMQMNRIELIDALRGLVHPTRFQETTYKPTAALRGLVAALSSPAEERVAPFRPSSKEPETITFEVHRPLFGEVEVSITHHLPPVL